MVQEEIIGMLRIALQRGKNLQQTVQSLYNSGYPRDEVDEAVQTLKMYSFQQPIQPPQPIKRQIQQPKQPAPQEQTQQIVSYYPAPKFQQPISQPTQFYQPQQIFPPEIVQRVSNYEQTPKANIGKIITIVMVIMLVILLGILVAVFMFKPELENFINNL